MREVRTFWKEGLFITKTPWENRSNGKIMIFKFHPSVFGRPCVYTPRSRACVTHILPKWIISGACWCALEYVTCRSFNSGAAPTVHTTVQHGPLTHPKLQLTRLLGYSITAAAATNANIDSAGQSVVNSAWPLRHDFKDAWSETQILFLSNSSSDFTHNAM